MLSNRSEPLYFGNTLWCSYAPADYQPCGYGFGPLQAAGARTTECPALPRGVSGRGPGSGAVGPFPYTAGLFWGVSYELVRWMAGSRLVYDFTHNASARFRYALGRVSGTQQRRRTAHSRATPHSASPPSTGRRTG